VPLRVLVIQHDHVSPPGPVAERFRHHGFEVDEFLVVAEVDNATPNVICVFPDLTKYDVIVPMGARWGAWDDERIGNWLLPELEFLTKAIVQDIPIFGICFGGQLLARALGGSVAPGPKPEIGWTVAHTDWPDLVSTGPWFQFHYDRWQLPAEALEVARNSAASQAFVSARNLGVQFHPELTPEMLTGWLQSGGRELVIADGQDPDILLAHTVAEQTSAKERTNQLVDTFLSDVAKLI
jgi:GMP synthase-like glutamine amidotransferase